MELSTTAYWECEVAPILGGLLWKEALTVVPALGGALIIIGGMFSILHDSVLKPRRAASDVSVEHEKPIR